MSDEQQGVPSFRSDSVDDTQIEVLVRLLDRQAALPGVRRLRQWAREALAVKPGEAALDVGSGTGSEVVAFAEAVGRDGRAVGVDPNPAMLAIAASRAGSAPAEFVEGTAYRLPFEDGSIDAVRCERVFQHLDDPVAATAEIARVLRPGGRVTLIDSDWATAITHPGDPDTVAALTRWMLDQSANPYSGRRLRGLLTRAGLAVVDIGSQAVIFDDDIDLFATALTRAVTAGVITEAQRATLETDLAAAAADGDYHRSVTMFAVLAHKPA
jgi:ubiquinone/menaquinone biosynthesis C-methylase UbiE